MGPKMNKDEVPIYLKVIYQDVFNNQLSYFTNSLHNVLFENQ